MAHRRVPAEHVTELAAALITLAANENGRAALKQAEFTEFRHGESASYDELWEFLIKYRRIFGSAKRGAS